MTERNKDFYYLDSFFNAACETNIPLSDELVTLVLADAAQVQSGFANPDAMPRRRGRLMQLFEVLGGWPSIGGLATATVAGVWIGVSPPDSLYDVTQAFLDTNSMGYLIDVVPGSGFDLIEEAL